MFITIPTGVNYMTRRYPVVTFTLMGVNTLLYIVALVIASQSEGGGWRHNWMIEHLGLVPAESVWYTYFTSMYVHAGFWHLFGNMIYLFLFGSCVEDIIGRWQFMIFYALGGFVADFGHIIASTGKFNSTIPMVGASGAISACMGGFVLLLHGNKIDFRYVIFFFLRFFTGEFSLPAWLVISFWFIKDLLFAILEAASEDAGGGVAFAAHAGGFIGGLAMVGLWKFLNKNGRLDPLREEAEDAHPAHAGAVATIYLFEGNVQSGPFSREQLAEMRTLGSLSAEALYWMEGMAEWRSIDELG